jgi:hypothetical protein
VLDATGVQAMSDHDSERQKLVRLPVLLSEEELAAIDDYRYSNRIPSRAAAIRQLLFRGLEKEDGGFS